MNEIDPTRATDPRVRRATFVAATAAATGAVAFAPALSQSDLGKPHPPLVAEDDPAIAIDRPHLQTSNGSIGSYAAWPRNATSNTPGIVLVMHIWGVDSQIRDTVRRLAKAGFTTIAPELYSRFGAPTGDGSTDFTIFRPFAQKLERPQVANDLLTAAKWITARQSGAKLGVTGFCMGGTIALRQAIDNPSVFAVDAVWYGQVAQIDPNAIHIPIVGNYGVRDTSIPADGVHAFAQALKVPNDIKEYDDAGHGFFDDTRRSYVADAAEDAWRRTLAYFNKYLKQ